MPTQKSLQRCRIASTCFDIQWQPFLRTGREYYDDLMFAGPYFGEFREAQCTRAKISCLHTVCKIHCIIKMLALLILPNNNSFCSATWGTLVFCIYSIVHSLISTSSPVRLAHSLETQRLCQNGGRKRAGYETNTLTAVGHFVCATVMCT